VSRLTVDAARTLWNEASDEELKALAQDVRARYHDPKQATYMVMRIINYPYV
jgi:2-iminoacetate synthase ThiH